MLYHLRHSTSPDIGKSNTTTGGKYISKNAKVLLLRKNVKNHLYKNTRKANQSVYES
jgi:hypothetical protein